MSFEKDVEDGIKIYKFRDEIMKRKDINLKDKVELIIGYSCFVKGGIKVCETDEEMTRIYELDKEITKRLN